MSNREIYDRMRGIESELTEVKLGMIDRDDEFRDDLHFVVEALDSVREVIRRVEARG